MVVISCYLEVDKDRALKYQTNESSYFNPIHDGGWGGGGGVGVGQKGPPTSFSPVTSINVGISLQNFPTFSCDSFNRLV